MTAKEKPLEWLWHFEVDASPDDLWPHVIESSRFNRALGISQIDYVERNGKLHGESVTAGLRQAWVEAPWEWVQGRVLFAVRNYSAGLTHHTRSAVALHPIDGGLRCRYSLYLAFIPRGILSRALLKVAVPSIRRRYPRLLREIAAGVAQKERPVPYVAAAPSLSKGGALRLSELGAQLTRRELPQDALNHLLNHIENADDLDLYRIQIRALARKWGISCHDLLRVCLHATRLGLLELSWDVLCPHCRGVRREATRLADLPEHSECDVCKIDFKTDLENAIEITFHIHPSIRRVPRIYYCAAEPSSKLHIKIRQTLSPGETRSVNTSLEAGRYRARLDGSEKYHYLDICKGQPTSTSWKAGSGFHSTATAAAPTLHLINDTEQVQYFIIEDLSWSDDALRPAALFNLQEFRDLFAEEYLASDVQLSVGVQTLMFTDMVGSTRFYASQGDPLAFIEVKKHFEEIFAVVRRHRGAVVKTIGDAVMAAFSNPLDAIKASREIHLRYGPHRSDSSIRLRISLNTGPCIAVNLNSSIDYFGSSVNVAAKLQACAESGQVAFSEAVRRAPAVTAYLIDEGVAPEELDFQSDAIEQSLRAFRWDIHADSGLRSS
jgi:class 3 adenylate cyclase